MLIRPALVLLYCVTALAARAEQNYPPVAPPKDTATLGANIQRTMTLLATSTPEKRNKVRILFYGQSITEQAWSKQVSEDLRKRFPHADIEIENRAIGGFASQLLVRTAEHDLYPFYPDLLIFHVYGANNTYEEIIANTRKRTTAEILMQKDHATKWPPEKVDQKQDGGMWWDHMMNNVFLPDYAKKYGCGLADVRSGWLEYMKANKLEPKDLLKDGVHLNAHGDYLMAQLVSRDLIHRPDLTYDKELVKTFVVGKDVEFKDGKLIFEFEGNRVDVIASRNDGGTAPAKISIDGKKPSEFPELYVFTRPSSTQAYFWPGIRRVSSEKPLIVEDWTAKITEADEAATKFKFDVFGSKTGADGSGTNDQKFVSKSGRVVIEAQDWWLKNAYDFAKKPLKAGFEVKWKAVAKFVDEYTAPKVEDASREHVTTLAQGLPNSKHTLEISGHAPIKEIRVYKPPLK